ncbi:MAG: cation diffusion facilitator family transporter [Oscillospiraceae bacterium]|nr:cation diffusion facilitator family transporter [Oscillospiraceae bacterium]
MGTQDKQRLAMRVSWSTIVVNAVLALLKLAAGMLANSAAMVSDAVHTFSDVFTTFIVMVGVRMSGMAPDKEHPYGHERMECVAAVLLSVILCATGLWIGYDGVQRVVSGMSGELQAPGILALAAAVLSIGAKEWMYWFTRAAAKKVNSGAMMADAWHHRTDGLSSIGSFIGILGARLGLPILDPLACLVICAFILKAAWDIFSDAMGKMTDRSCGDTAEARIREIAETHKGVLSVDSLRTRLFGDRVFVDLEIGVDSSVSLDEAHETAQQVHDAIESEMPEVKHCMVHVNPAQRSAQD